MRARPGCGIVPAVGGVSVLVVDDHVLFAEAVAARLSQEPDIGPVDAAFNGDDACGHIAVHRPQVVVLDLILGDTSGMELAGYIRDVSPSSRIIMLTGVDSVDAVVSALRRGVRAWLPKTVDPAHLVEVIHGVHRGEVWLSPDLLGQVLPYLLGSAPAPADPLAGLTAREREVLQCLVDGLPRDRIAARLHVSTNTVRTHVQNLLAKLGVHATLEAVALARRYGMQADAAVLAPGSATGSDT